MIKREDLKKWNKSSDILPNEGVLCVIFFPIGERKAITEKENNLTFGPIAITYYRENEGWIYADRPSQLSRRWSKIELENCYWIPFEKINL